MKSCWAILTGEYPPQPGGVSDYTRLVAQGLAHAGDEVHVWSPPSRAEPRLQGGQSGVIVHRLPDHFGPAGLTVLTRELTELPGPWRILVQYVPHAFGYKAMNVPFCLWLWSRRGYQVWTMFHEVAFPWVATPLKHNLLSGVHRVMALLVARSSKKIFVSTPAWIALLSPLIMLSDHITWVPVPSNLPTEMNLDDVAALRRTLAAPGCPIVGYFGSFGGPIRSQLLAVVPRLLAADARRVVLLLGRGGETFARDFTALAPESRDRLVAPGEMSGAAVARHLAACDLLVLPFPDGASSRRSSLMAALALGVPVLTTAGPSTEPLWRDSDAVALVGAGDSEALTTAADHLLADPSKRTALAARGARLYRERFGIDRTIEILRSAAGASSKRGTEGRA